MKKLLTAAAAAALAFSSSAAMAEYYRPGLLGVNTNLRPASPAPAPAPAPRPVAPAPAPMSRNIDLRPLPPRPLIERPAPAPLPSPAPRVNVQASPGDQPSQGNLHVTAPVTPKTSVTGTVTGTLNLPPNQGTPTLDGAKVDVTHSTP
ncbi:hypothetical protein [Bradyrhizobium sp. CCBAU 11445]|uniref:hypothetical protein n=1 Tax=Bradyrhizobium sp. CCBAU 11445 TaxID=1630896 RepID=UPI00230575F3|nr:hypothetical protein [Bradyrhizobium sp. CCBAU 11445]